jgi:hypothetical protein
VKNNEEKLLLIFIGSIIWVAVCIVFVDFLPSHPHLKYSALLSPFILLTTLIEPLTLFKDGLPEGIYIGLVYWLWLIAIVVMPKNVIRR